VEKNKKVLQGLRKEKENTKQLVIISVLISFGVNTLTTGILSYYNLTQNSVVLIIGGVLFSLGIILFMFIWQIKRLNKDIDIKGFVIYNRATKEIVPIPNYYISEDMERYLKASFVENKALNKLWYEDPIDEFKLVRGKNGEDALAIASHSGAIFIELIEYCIIERLSTHLSSYFNNSDLEKVSKLKRKDIPDVLLENRFLRLFSEDMHNREAFNDNKVHVGGLQIVSVFYRGAIYQEFDLILPHRSRIKRINKNKIVIDTNMLSLTISCLFGGFGTNLKRGFRKFYLGIKEENELEFNDYQFNVRISIKFKLRSLSLSDNWKYYMWADDFIEELTNYLSQDSFFHRVNWDTVYSILRCEQLLKIEQNDEVL